VKKRAKPVTFIKAHVPRFSFPPRRGLALSELLPILYPGLGELPGFEGFLADAQALCGGGRVHSLAEIRRLLGFFDRQWYPSPVRVRLARSEVRWHQQDGLQFAIDPESGSPTPDVLLGKFEPHVSAVMRRVCRPGWHAVDVGANSGYHTVRLASLVGGAGSVLAIEANPDNCVLIEAAVERNGFMNVRILPVGLGRQDGWGWFTECVGSNGGLVVESSPSKVRDLATIVPLFRLDRLIGTDSVDFIKMDVEGAEGLVVEGGKETIARHRPVVVSEFSWEMMRRVSGVEPGDYLSFFARLGYQLYVIDAESPGRLVSYSPDDLLKSWPGELHIEDLLFLPEEKDLTDGPTTGPLPT
jgi:FkbM family methyltransferase